MEAHINKKHPELKTAPMVKLYNQGWSTTQIADKFGIFKSSVSRRLKKEGIKLKDSSDYAGSKRYWLWKGEDYIDPVTRKRNQRKHRKWSKAVLSRDGFTCQDCKVQKVKLHAHHLISLRECIDTNLEFQVDNGITLCVPCHGARHRGRMNRGK